MISTSYRFLLYFLALTICSAVALNNDKTFELSIIHFSDFHARFVEVSPTGGLCYEQDKDKCIGGISRVGTVVDKLKKIRKNPILLNAGDSFQGTLYYDLFKGNITAQFMNKLKIDAHTLGNHDLDEKVAGLASYLKQLNSPLVAANVDFSEEPLLQNLLPKSTVIRRGGRQIGVIGVAASNTNKLSPFTGKLKFLNEVQSINVEAKKLKAQGTDILIVLSHCGVDPDKIIARECPDVDVIVGGHNHLLFYNGESPSKENVIEQYPAVVTQKETNRKVLIVHASAYTKYVGDLQVVFDDKGEISEFRGNPIYLDQTVNEDASYLEELMPWKIAADRVGKRLLGKTLLYLNGSCYSGECSMANLITDAMVDTYAHEASVGFVTANSIQNSIPKGPIVYEDIYTTMPFGNAWNLIELKGSDLLQVIEENVIGNQGTTFFTKSRLIHWSGLKVVYNLKNAQSKIVSAKVRCLRCENPKFEEIDSEQWYRIVVPSFLLTEAFKTIFTKHRLVTTGTTIDVENLVNYVEKQKIINVSNESRIVFL